MLVYVEYALKSVGNGAWRMRLSSQASIVLRLILAMLVESEFAMVVDNVAPLSSLANVKLSFSAT